MGHPVDDVGTSAIGAGERREGSAGIVLAAFAKAESLAVGVKEDQRAARIAVVALLARADEVVGLWWPPESTLEAA